MNVSQLRAFIEVVEHGSFSAAARTLGVSQPAVTMQIQGLEGDVGATLLERRYRKVELTEAGRTLLPHARSVLKDLDAARDEIERLTDTVTGHLALAASTTPGQYVLPRLLGAFVRTNPEVTVSMVVRDTTEVVEMVESGEAQLGMTGARIPGSKVTYEPMGVDRLLLIGPPGHPLATKKAVPLADLVEEQFVARESGSGTRMVFEEALREGGVEPADLRVVLELSTSEAIVSAVEGGLGLGVVSHWMADKAIELETVVEIDSPHFPVERPLYAVAPKGEPRRAARELLDHMRATLGG